SFRVFYHSSTDTNSLLHNGIKALCLDSKQQIWVGSQNGINIFTQTHGFNFNCRPVSHHAKEPKQYDVRSLFELSAGQMLAGTANGLIMLTSDTAGYNLHPLGYGLQDITISSLAEDKEHTIWAGTVGNGIYRISPDFKSLRQFTVSKNSAGGPVSNIIRKIITDKNGLLWIGTLKGLNVLDPVSLRFETYVHDPANERSLNFNSIYDIMQDRQGSIWIATYFGGLNRVESITTPFTVYRNDDTKNSLSSDIVGPVLEDEKGNLWISTEAEGLNYFDHKTKQFRYFRNDETNPASLSSNLVKTLLTDNQKNIWVGMHGGGINVLDVNGKKIKEFNTKSLNSNDVYALMADSDNRIWAGTENDGINIIDPEGNKVWNFDELFPKNPLASKSITYLLRDSKNNIWIGTRQGLSKLESGNGKLINYVRNSAPGQLLSDYINCIAEDKEGRIWFGTYSGLSYYDPLKNRFETYTISDGLAGQKVVGLVTDDRNNLWISTNNGISLLNADRKTWQNFTVEDGLPGNVFNYNSSFCDTRGTIYFGGFKGLVAFNPSHIQINKAAPSIQFTGLKVNGMPVSRSDGSGILSTDISQTKKIVLRYDQNAVTVDYAVMNFIKPGKNLSAYMLEGYHTNWQYTTGHSASFNSLPPRSYRLLVKGCNNDGIWNNEPIALQLIILPPPWKTWWAYTLYSLTVGLLAFMIIWFISSRTALRRKLKFEHMLHLKQEELHQMKMDFFTHISHEIRTPLTLIMGPVEMLLMKHKGKSEDSRLLEIVKNNSERLLKLTTDLIAFRKVDAGHTQLVPENRDIVAFTRLVFQKFEEQAHLKSINYSFETSLQSCLLLFDAHQMEIVVSNLLYNALKFTQEGGKVWVTITKKVREIYISVYDNGPGIPLESQDKIFSTFYQADNVKNTVPGSGIGLAFSKKLVELHGGKLTFTS
ncbi:MAG: ATP-binding protein, partial [Chitinophagaceae bacterium]|nr:ATP-binding protein [Chitinophagaceae bacterium]